MLADLLDSPMPAVPVPRHQGPDTRTSRNNPTSDGGSGNGAHLAVNLGPRRSTAIAAVLAVAVLLLTGYALLEMSSGATSPVVISSDKSSLDVVEGREALFEITLTNTGETSQTVQMSADWLSGSPWEWNFTQIGGAPLDEVRDTSGQLVHNGIVVPGDGSVSFHFVVQVPMGEADVTSRITLAGIDNYGSYAGNVTRQDDGTDLTLTINAVHGLSVALELDAASQSGNTLAYQEQSTAWGYTVRNEGYYLDTYNLEVIPPAAGWSIETGFAPGTEIEGLQSDAAPHTFEGLMAITPPANARPGNYDIHFDVSSIYSGVSDTGTITVTIPAPDLQVTALTFSHAAVWITSKGDTQTVQIYATVTNTGGSVDANDHRIEYVDVWFLVDEITIGIQYIDALPHGESAIAVMEFQPHDDGMLQVQVLVDTWNNQGGENPEDVSLQESNEANNEANAKLRVIRVRANSPSFYLGFTALVVAVLGAVTLSAYHRRREGGE